MPSAATAAPSPTSTFPEFDAIQTAIAEVLRGKQDVIASALAAIIAGGHLLLEDVPGVGKSTLARSLARVLGGEFRRIQFTSDLLPADIMGVNLWRPKLEEFEFRRGPIFANFVLADEINRAPPRTQSALLEAMEERQVSIDGITYPLPRPFTVIATQNPIEHHGTYPLPESQRDRFLVRLHMGYTSAELEAELLQGKSGLQALTPLITPERLEHAQVQASSIFVHPDIASYAQRIVAQTRDHRLVRIGVSTRGALAWMQAARARALLARRDHVAIDDLQALAAVALAHRILVHTAMTTASSTEEFDLGQQIIGDIVATTPVPD
jgi:MoxR-like ATPase